MADFNERFSPSPIDSIAAVFSGWNGGPKANMFLGSPLQSYRREQQGPSASQQEIYNRNSPYVSEGAGGFNTQLPPLQEMMFRNWVSQNKVPFDPGAGVTDYDMRGFWSALQGGHPKAVSAVNQNDGQMHYPDYWKTPYHESFSGDSQWAGPNAPKWNDKDQLVAPDGKVIYDERKRK